MKQKITSLSAESFNYDFLMPCCGILLLVYGKVKAKAIAQKNQNIAFHTMITPV